MLADLALLLALWCLLAQAEDERRWRWAAFVLAGTVAVYSEYRSAIVIIAMVIPALWLGRPRRRPTLVAAMLGVIAAAVLRRRWPEFDLRARDTITVLAATAVLTLIGYALAAIVGVEVFTQRYATILVPFAAGLAAVALVAFPRRWLVPAAAVLLLALGVGNFTRRLGGQWEPDLTPVRVQAQALQPRTVLTDTPVVLYYLSTFRPVFDRPDDLGPGLAGRCARPCLIVDDDRVHGGTPRQAAGARAVVGPYVITTER